MSNVAGMFSGALMTVALLAVPCMAVFGLPSVGQAVTDPASKEGISLAAIDDLGAPTATAHQTAEAPAFAPLVDAAPAPSSPAGASGGKTTAAELHLDPTSDRRGAAANMAAGLGGSSRTAQPAPDAPEPAEKPIPENVFAQSPETAEPTPAASRSWEDSVARLNKYGINDFHLTNGEVAGQFHFSCSMKDAGPNVTRRFEAEGPSPVAAAEDVLAQVEQCFATR